MSKYTVESWYINTEHGIWINETRVEEFDSLEEVEKYLLLYKLEANIGYKVYDCSLKQFHNSSENYKKVIKQWFDKDAYTGNKPYATRR